MRDIIGMPGADWALSNCRKAAGCCEFFETHGWRSVDESADDEAKCIMKDLLERVQPEDPIEGP